MSKSNIRKRVARVVARKFKAGDKELLSKATRLVLQSNHVSQCLSLDAKALEALWQAYKAREGTEAGSETDYKAAIYKVLRAKHKNPKRVPALNSTYFKQLMQNNGLVWGQNLIYTGVRFVTIGKWINNFNDTRYVGPRNRPSAQGQRLELDHGISGTGQAAIGGVPAMAAAGARSGKPFIEQALMNLKSVMPDTTVYSRNRDLIVNWDAFVTKAGKIKAGLGIILEPTSGEFNREQGVRETQEFNLALRAVEAAVSGINMAELEGSGSIKDKVTNQLLSKFEKPGVKVTKTARVASAKAKTSTKVVEKIPRSKVRARVPNHKDRVALTEKRALQPSRDSSLARIMMDINAQLHAVVRSRMGVAGVDDTSGPLVYRTGEFARSIEVTGVGRTPGGFANLMYTFQAHPYDVFSRGHSLYTEQRDPEILIDQSIRQIVAGRLGARFYTRRTY